MDIKTALKIYRFKSKLTQQELAKKLKVSPVTISRWETGKNEPPIKILAELSQIMKEPITITYSNS